MKMKKAVAVFLTLTMMFSMSFMSLSYPGIQDLFSLRASAQVDDVITKYAPEGTRDVAVDASVTASSS